MANETKEEEPSIEEILDSIRQIISDDDDDDADVGDDSAAVDDDDDIVELTDKIDTPVPEPELDPDTFDVFDAGDEEEDEIAESEPEAMPEPEPEPPVVKKPIKVEMRDPIDEDEKVIAGIAETAALEGFEHLVKKTAVEYNGITVEEIVRTELKPLLREWLDNHLPSMIERLVQEELERISKRVLED